MLDSKVNPYFDFNGSNSTNELFLCLFLLQDIFSGSTHLSDSSTLILERVDRHHAGVYQCAADNGVREPVSMDINLTILCEFSSFVQWAMTKNFCIVDSLSFSFALPLNCFPDCDFICVYRFTDNAFCSVAHHGFYSNENYIYIFLIFLSTFICILLFLYSTAGNYSWKKLGSCQWRLWHWIGLYYTWWCYFRCKCKHILLKSNRAKKKIIFISLNKEKTTTTEKEFPILFLLFCEFGALKKGNKKQTNNGTADVLDVYTRVCNMVLMMREYLLAHYSTLLFTPIEFMSNVDFYLPFWLV